MSIEPLKLILILVGTLLLGAGGVITASGFTQRLMLTGLLSGLAFYSGIGASDSEVPFVYIVYYYLFFMAVIIGFHFGRAIFLPLSRSIGRKSSEALRSVSHGISWYVVIAIYVLLSLIPLVWPKFRLHHLLMPPKPDLRDAFYRRFTEEPDAVIRLIGYIKLLLTPFFYIALYRWRFYIGKIFVLLVFLMYIDYVTNAYIGRGSVLMNLGLIILGIWILRPKYRRRIIVAGIILMPFFFYAFYLRMSTKKWTTVLIKN